MKSPLIVNNVVQRRTSLLLWTLALTVALGLPTMLAHAQADFEKGFQGYQSYHGSDFDVVNLANGNLMLNIPLLSYEQRGGLAPIVVSIRSNSTTFQSDPPYLNGPLDTTQHEVSSGVIGAPWGQPHVVISPGGLTWKEERVTTASHTANGGPEYLVRFVAIDNSGATHSLGGNVANLTAGVVPGIRYSVDGSGLMLQPANGNAGQIIVDRNGNTGGLNDLNGNSIALKGQCATAPGTGDLFNPSLAEWEGYAHGTASATSIVDSIGRVIPNPTYLPPAVPYSCIVDIDGSYQPAASAPNGCETWNFPGQAGSFTPLIFCYQQIHVGAAAVIPTPFLVNTTVPNGGESTSPCAPGINIYGAPTGITCETINETWWVLKSVTLPNDTQWQFGYDGYGQLDSVTMPTGAVIAYTYNTRLACGNPPGQIPVVGVSTWPYSNLMSSRIVAKRTLDLRDGSALQVWKYNNQIGTGWGGSPNSGQVVVTDPEGNDTVHTFSLIGGSVCGPYETSTQYYQGLYTANVELKQVDTKYSFVGTDYANPTNFSNYIAVGVYPDTVTTTLFQSSTPDVSQDSYVYDKFGTYQDYTGITHPFSFGELLSEQESDWGSNSPGAILRTTLHTHTWQSNWNYYAKNLIDLPCLDTVFTGSYPPSISSPALIASPQPSCTPSTTPSSQAAQTSYAYDETAYTPGYNGTLGNLTSTSHWLQGGAAVTTHSVYNANLNPYGMPSQKIDAKGNPTLLAYDASKLYLSSIQYPNPNVADIEYTYYDDPTGLLNQHKDANGQITYYSYDSMRRLNKVQFPDTGKETYIYNDAPFTSPSSTTPSFTYTKILNSAGSTYTAVGSADALGRMIHTQVLDPEETIFKDTYYDQLGRVEAVSNPYRSITTDLTYGVTSYSYDALGRKLYQCQQDNLPIGAITCNPSNSYLQWTYPGNTVNSYDELQHLWQRTSDGLGRLTQVIEPGSLYTTYSYDVLGNVKCVDQWGSSQPGPAPTPCTSARYRQFTYDSLSRLLTSYNPETGTICYGQLSGGCVNGYDANGNLLHKTDARGITTNYSYDSLNRLTSRSYSNDTTGTAASCYQYDTSSLNSTVTGNLVGRLTNAWTQVGSCPAQANTAPSFPSSITLSRRSIVAYDTMGRISNEQQCTLSNCASSFYNPTYTYDQAGNILTHTNGLSGSAAMQFTNVYDSVNRLAQVFNGATTGTPIFSAPSYSPAGGLTAAQFGSGLNLSRTYDRRLRIASENDTGGNAPQNPTPATATIQILH